jgi:glyoxylase-like metal-dependent hydrolase (beta-lactamase superfamily II)
MRIHHLNCVSSCPLGGRLMDGRTASIFERGRLCCHCLLLETNDGLTLVDTGFGLNDVRNPRGRLSAFFLAMLSPDFREGLTAVRQIERLGFRAEDVRHILLTHLDFDHAGGLDDFPRARVHLLRQERDAAVAQRSWLDRQRFRPQQWTTSRSRWTMHDSGRGGDRWYGFEGVVSDEGLPADVLLVPLLGHTLGHVGIAVRQREQGRWLVHAGDAYFWHEEMDPERPRCTPGLRFYQWMMEKDRRARLHNQQRLRALRASPAGVDVFCAHDPAEFERLAGREMGAE